MKSLFVGFILLVFSMNLFAEAEPEKIIESKVNDYKIDLKYIAGEYLLYDCEKRHYACVSVVSFLNCKEDRKSEIKAKAKGFSCAPLEKFASKKICLEKSYKIVYLNAPKRFCYPHNE
jgi:hypothetical protein